MEQFSLKNSIIFDTETTGVKLTDEIIELGVIDGETGEVLIQTLFKPTKPIPAEATDIHGISNEDVADAPTFISMLPEILELFHGKRVVAYNSSFDHRMLMQTAVTQGSSPEVIQHIKQMEHHCAMLWYAEHIGEPGHRGDFKWHKLTVAAAMEELDVSDLNAHRATDDCEITRRVIAKVNNDLARV